MTTTAHAGLLRSGHGGTARNPADYSGDLVRLVLAVIVFALSILAIRRNHLSTFEADVFRLVNDLPDWLTPFFWTVMHFGDMLAPIVIGLIVIFWVHRTRIGISIMLAGAGAWALAQVLKLVVERGRPEDFLDDLTRVGSSGGAGFVSGHTAVATAMAAVLAPNLPRRWRRLVWAVPVLVALGRMYSGVHLPLDLVGGFAVGWFVGTLVHMLLGVDLPARTPEVVADMLTRLGLEVATVQPAHVRAKVSHPFRVTTVDGRRLFAKVLDPDPRSTDWVLRLARVFATRERRDISALAALPAAADHEAAVTMAARSTGARVPQVVLARGDGTAAVVVLEEVPGGKDLAELPAELLTDAVLDDLWSQVATLRSGRVAHRDLVRGNVILDRDGNPWLADFFDGQVGADQDSLDGDVAELIASLAVAVGPERAVSGARAVLGDEAVDRALPRLEIFALSPRTRQELVHRPELLDAVRAEAGGGPDATAEVLDLRRLRLPALLAVVGYGVLLTVAGWQEVLDLLPDSLLRWVAVAGAAFVVTPLLHGYAISLALHRRVAIGRSATAAALASSAEVLGGRPARRHHLRNYMRSCGARGDDPDTAVDLVLSAELGATVLVLLGALVVDVYRESLHVTGGRTVLMFVAVAAVAAVVAGFLRRRAAGSWPRTSLRAELGHALREARSAPARPLAVLAAITGGEVALVLALASALRFVGPWEPVAVVALALAGTRLLLAVVNLPSAPVVSEAVCAAALCALGVPPPSAVVAVLVFTTYRYWVTGAVSAVVAPRLAPVHVGENRTSPARR
ncbi:MAG TPA: phosphatase PAP2 family protein [Nocardioidaceae bacterium]